MASKWRDYLWTAALLMVLLPGKLFLVATSRACSFYRSTRVGPRRRTRSTPIERLCERTRNTHPQTGSFLSAFVCRFGTLIRPSADWLCAPPGGAECRHRREYSADLLQAVGCNVSGAKERRIEFSSSHFSLQKLQNVKKRGKMRRDRPPTETVGGSAR
jgi:hypothetical protein